MSPFHHSTVKERYNKAGLDCPNLSLLFILKRCRRKISLHLLIAELQATEINTSYVRILPVKHLEKENEMEISRTVESTWKFHKRIRAPASDFVNGSLSASPDDNSLDWFWWQLNFESNYFFCYQLVGKSNGKLRLVILASFLNIEWPSHSGKKLLI